MATQHTARSRRTREDRRVVRKLLLLTERMRDTAQELELAGHVDKAGQLRGAASVSSGWAMEIEISSARSAQRVAA